MNEDEKTLTEEEKKLIKTLFTRSKIASPFFVAAIVFAVMLVLPVMIIDITTHYNTNATIFIVFAIVPSTIAFICWIYNFSSSRRIVKSERWAIILEKINSEKDEVDRSEQKRGEQALSAFATYASGNIAGEYFGVEGAKEFGTAVSGIMTGITIFSLMSAINKHAQIVAQYSEVALPNLTSKKLGYILLIPSIVIIIVFSIIYGISGGSRYKEVNDSRTTKIDEINNILSQKAGDYYIKVDDEIGDAIRVHVTKEDEELGIRSSMIIEYDKNDVLKSVSYNIDFTETSPTDDYATVRYKRPSKIDALNIAINDITSLNALLQSLNIDSEVVRLYLPSDEFKQAFLSTENWEDLVNSSTSDIGYPAENAINGNAQYALKNRDLGMKTISDIVLYVK